MSTGFTHEKQSSTASSDETNQWFTPKYIFDALGAKFDLDPCSPGEGLTHVPATRHLTVLEDGLTAPWDGLVFMNPPYGKHTGEWMRKLSEHGNGIALVFARTDVKWFQDNIHNAGLVCFVSSRIKFHKGHIGDNSQIGTPGTGSMLIAYGDKATERLAQSGLGVLFEPFSKA